MAFSLVRTRQWRVDLRPEPVGSGAEGGAGVRGGVKFPRDVCGDAGRGVLRFTRPTTSRRRHLPCAVHDAVPLTQELRGLQHVGGIHSKQGV